MKGMEIPAGAVEIKDDAGKPVYCNKDLKCRCYRLKLLSKHGFSMIGVEPSVTGRPVPMG